MTDQELIDYCELHCETQRALFSGAHINRMCELAGLQAGVEYQEVSANRFLSMHDEMKFLVIRARKRLQQEQQCQNKQSKNNLLPYWANTSTNIALLTTTATTSNDSSYS